MRGRNESGNARKCRRRGRSEPRMQSLKAAEEQQPGIRDPA